MVKISDSHLCPNGALQASPITPICCCLIEFFQEKKNIGDKWEEASNNKALFLMAVKHDEKCQDGVTKLNSRAFGLKCELECRDLATLNMVTIPNGSNTSAWAMGSWQHLSKEEILVASHPHNHSRLVCHIHCGWQFIDQSQAHVWERRRSGQRAS